MAFHINLLSLVSNLTFWTFEWMIWGASAVMVAGAIRGAPFFIAVSIGIFARELRKSASAAFAGAAAQGGDRFLQGGGGVDAGGEVLPAAVGDDELVHAGQTGEVFQQVADHGFLV